MKSSYSIATAAVASAGNGKGGSTVVSVASKSALTSPSSNSPTSSSSLSASSSSSSSSSSTSKNAIHNKTSSSSIEENTSSGVIVPSSGANSGVGNSRKCQMVKCVFVGDGAIGKTSLIVSYTTNGYPAEYVPTAFDTYSVVVTIDNKPCQLQLCDTAGQDDFDSIRPLCYKYTDVFMVCFSVVSPASFQNVRQKWLPELRRSIQNGTSGGGSKKSGIGSTPPFILVGTQCDLRHDVKVLIELDSQGQQPIESDYARTMAKKFGAICYIECSALTQKNLKEVFDTAIISALDFQSHSRPSSGKNPNNPNNNISNNNGIYVKSKTATNGNGASSSSSQQQQQQHRMFTDNQHHRNQSNVNNDQQSMNGHDHGLVTDLASTTESNYGNHNNRTNNQHGGGGGNNNKHYLPSNRANISDARLVGWRKSLTKLSAQEALESESVSAINHHHHHNNNNRNSTSNPTLPTSADSYCYSSSGASSSSKTNSSSSCSESAAGMGLAVTSVPILAKSTYSPLTPHRHLPRHPNQSASSSSSPVATRALLHPTTFNPMGSKPLILSSNRQNNNNNNNNNKKRAHISKNRHKHLPNQLTSDPEDDQGFHDVEEEEDDSVACDKIDSSMNYDDRICLSTAKSNCHYYYHQHQQQKQQQQHPVPSAPSVQANSAAQSARSKQSSPSYYYYQNRPLPSQPSPYGQHQYHYSPKPSQPVPTTTAQSQYSSQYQPVYQPSRSQPTKLQSFFQHFTRPSSSSSGSSAASITRHTKLNPTNTASVITPITATHNLQSPSGNQPKALFSNQTNLATTLRSSSFFFLSSNTFKKKNKNNKKKENDLKSSLQSSSSNCSGSSSSASSIVSNSLFKNSKNGSNLSYRSEIFQIMSNSVTELRNRKSLLKKFTSSYSSSSTSSSSNEKSRLKSKKLKDLYYYDYDEDDYEEIDTNERRSKCFFSCCLPF